MSTNSTKDGKQRHARKAKDKTFKASSTVSDKPRLNKQDLMSIASTTLDSISRGCYTANGETYNLAKKVDEMKKGTRFYSADSELSSWKRVVSDGEGSSDVDEATRKIVEISIHEVSTLEGTRTLSELLATEPTESKGKIGVLNFASAKNPGGGFLTGAQAQEESIARSSTAYSSFMTETAQVFYRSHRKDPKEGYYSHAMIYSPSTLFIRSDNGNWAPPVEVDLLTSCAVNAGVVRRYLREANSTDESDLDAAMMERMARVLYLFEKQGVKNLVLGSFGTGVFRNRVELVASHWKELLVGDKARFAGSFDRVVFAILGYETFETFKRVFYEPDSGASLTDNEVGGSRSKT